MKKISKILLITLSLALLTSCGGSTHTHKWSSYFDNDDGTHTRTCLKDVNHIETEPHTFKEEEVIAEPTEVSPGTSKMVCSKCGYTETVIIPPLGDHVFDKEVISDLYLYEKCSEYSSIYYKSCECGAFGDPNCLFEHSLLPEGYSNVEYIQGTGEQVIDTGIDKNKVSSISYNECKKGRGRLPYNYQEVEYIEFTGAQYIDTLIKGEASWEFVLDWTPQSDLECMGYKGSSNEYFSVRKGYYAVYNKSQVKPNPKDNVKFTYEKTSAIYVNGEKVLDNATTNDVSKNTFTIGALSKNLFCNFKFYSGKATKEGKVIAEFVPSYNVETNEIGLYDITNEAFLPGIGDTKLKKGKDVTYGSRLPADYQEVEYIKNIDGAYINTNYVPNNNTGFEIDYRFDDISSANCLFGAGGSDYNHDSYEIYLWDEKVQFNLDDFNDYIFNGTLDRTKIGFQNNELTVSGGSSLVKHIDFDTHPTLPLVIFGLNRTAYDEVQTLDYSAYLYSFKLYEDNVLIHDYVPCYKISGNIPGLYDLVTHSFLSNAGKGSFEVGKNVNPQSRLPAEYQEVEYIESTGTQYIDTGISAVGGIKTIYKGKFNEENANLVGSHGFEPNYNRNGANPHSSGKWELGYGDVYPLAGSYDLNSIYEIEFATFPDEAYLNVNGERIITDSGQILDEDLNIWLFNNQYHEAFADSTFKGVLYYVQLFNSNNVLVGDYVPCYKKDDLSVGMYDLITNKFLKNIGTGEFIRGPEVNPQSRLPVGYQELDYIESTGTQYIDTGIAQTNKTTINCSLHYKCKQNTGNYLFGGRQNANAFLYNGCYIRVTDDQNKSIDNYEFNYHEDSFPVNDGNFVMTQQLFDDEVTITINGKSSIKKIGEVEDNSSIYLFACNNSIPRLFQGNIKCYSFEIYNDNNLVRSYVPSIRSNDNKVGLYDLVSGAFYTNQGTGEFIKGNIINPQSRLPVGYQELEYIESTGTQRISTGIISDTSLKIEARVYTDFVQSEGAIIGGNPGTKSFELFTSESRPHYTFWNSNCPSIESDISVNQIVDVVIDNKEFKVNDSSYVLPVDAFGNDTPITLFAYNSSGKFPSSSRIYSCKIYKNNNLVRDFIPCYRTDNLSIGMFDLVTRQFFANEGTGEFIRGPEVNPQSRLHCGYQELDYIKSTGTQYIDTGVVFNPTTMLYQIGYSIDSNHYDGNTVTFGSRNADLSNGFYQDFDFHVGTDKNSEVVIVGPTLPTDTFIDEIFSNNILIVDKKIYQISNPIEKNDSNFMLFALGEEDHATAFSSNSISYFKLYENSNLIRDMIPVEDSFTGKLGLYDLVNNIFYPNEGTGEFIRGPEVNSNVNNNNKVTNITNNSEPSDIPNRYTQIEYVESTGTQYVDTGYIPTNNTGYDVVFSVSDVSKDQVIFGQRTDGSRTWFGVEGNSIYCGWNDNVYNNTVTGDNAKANQIYNIKGNFENDRKYYEDDKLIRNVNDLDNTPTQSLTIFAGNAESIMAYTKGRIYSVNISEGTKIVMSLIPCIDTATNQVGFYDTVGGKFYNNSGTGDLIAGPIKKSSNTIQIPYYYSGNVSSYNYGRVYDATINYKDGTSAKLIPAIRNSDSVLGMYDVTNNVFYPTTSEEQFKTNGVIGHHLDNGVVTKKATYDEDGEMVYTCSICGAQIHEVIPKLSYKATFTYDEGIESIKIYSNDKDPNAYEISNVGYTRNLFSYNYSKNNAGIYFEIVFKDGYTLDEIEYDSLKCLYSDEQEHKLFYMLIDDIEVNITSKK